MAQGISSHLNRGNGYERSGPRCRSLVPIRPGNSPLSGHCEDGQAGCSTQGAVRGNREDL